MQPTSEQWAAIEESLDTLFTPVYLRCDGYLVRAMMQRVGKTRVAIVVSVNGWQIRGEWLPLGGRSASEEVRRFWRPRTIAVFSARERRDWEKKFGKRSLKARGLDRRLPSPEPIWPRPRPFIAHLKAHNERIEVIEPGRYADEVEALLKGETA